MLNGFGTVVNALGKRVKPYLPQICGTILWRLNNKSAKVRQQAADLISRIAIVMKTCQEVGVVVGLIILPFENAVIKIKMHEDFTKICLSHMPNTCFLTTNSEVKQRIDKMDNV